MSIVNDMDVVRRAVLMFLMEYVCMYVCSVVGYVRIYVNMC